MKRFAGYALLALCVLSLVGCGGGGSGSGGSSLGTPASTAQTPAPYSAAGLTHLHRISITETIKPAQWFIDANAIKKIGGTWHIGVTQRRKNSGFETDAPYYNYGSLGSSQAVAFNTMNGFASYVQGMGTPYIELNGGIPFVFQSGTPPSGGTPQVYAYPANFGGAFTKLAIGFVRSKAIARSFGNKLIVMDYQYNQGGSGGAAYMNTLDYPINPTAATAFPQDTLILSNIQLDAAHAFLTFDFDKFQDNLALYAYLSRADKLAPDLGGQAAGHLHLLSHDGTTFSQLALPLPLSAVATASSTLWTPYRIKLVQDGSDATKPLIALIDETNQQATLVRFDGTALSVVASGLALPTGFNASSPMAARNGVLYIAVGANLYRSNATTFERLHSSIFDASQIISIGALSADANGVVAALSRNDAAYTLRYLIDVVQVP